MWKEKKLFSRFEFESSYNSFKFFVIITIKNKLLEKYKKQNMRIYDHIVKKEKGKIIILFNLGIHVFFLGSCFIST